MSKSPENTKGNSDKSVTGVPDTKKSGASQVAAAQPKPAPDRLEQLSAKIKKAQEASKAASFKPLDLHSIIPPPVRPVDLDAIRRSLEAFKIPEPFSFSQLVPSTQVQKLEAEIAARRSDLQKRTIELQTEQKTRKELEAKLQRIQEDQAKLKEAEELAFILNRVTPRAHSALFRHQDLRDKFFEKSEQQAYVVAIDIRRSTELMLKARRPELFANFMTSLCDQLQLVIKNHFGVFDKFTGDGILAFFPDFFTGPDAAYHAVAVAHEAQGIFASCYKEHRGSFTSVLTDVHLATGIDYGPVHLVRVADGLTVVGAPVVYACRLSSSGAGGNVLLNQGAFEKIADKYSKFFYIDEQELEIKHEGPILCYNVKPGTATFTPTDSAWLKEQVEPEILSSTGATETSAVDTSPDGKRVGSEEKQKIGTR